MIKQKFAWASASVVFIAAALYSCTHQLISTSPDTVSTTCSADSVYFANDILPILNSNCAMSGCHSATSHKEGVILNNYSNTLKTTEINKGNADESELYKVMISNKSDKVMPPSGKLSQDITDKIKKWINQGALNNSCLSCDTSSEMKYSVQISGIMTSYCTGCHNVNNSGGGINLDNYNDVKTQALNGNLLGSIEHQNGYSPMPQNQAQIPDCKINQIKKWINNGTPNN